MGYRSAELTRSLRAQYPEGFAILHRAIELGEALHRAKEEQPHDTATKFVIATIAARMFNNLCAATLLLEEGYGVQAGIVARAFLEDYFNIFYIINNQDEDSEALALRFISFQYAERYLQLIDLRAAGIPVSDEEYRYAEEERRQYWDEEYGWNDKDPPRDWSGRSLRRKAVAARAMEAYQWFSRYFNAMVHGSPDAYQPFVIETNHGPRYRTGPQNVLIEFPMPALGYLFTQVARAMAGLFDLPEIQSQAKETGRFIEERLKSINMRQLSP